MRTLADLNLKPTEEMFSTEERDFDIGLTINVHDDMVIFVIMHDQQPVHSYNQHIITYDQ